MAADAATPDYGLDAPILVKRMFTRAGWSIAIGLALFIINHTEYPSTSTELLVVFALIAVGFVAVGAYMVWSSRKGKIELRDKLLDSLALKGDEKVLDVGCGLGLMLIGMAKRLKAGKATGVDVWNAADLSGNSADAVKQNAKLEGVADKVRVEQCDARKLVYPDKNYDVVVSSLAIHNIDDEDGRNQAVREMWRVLKPGGRILILDILHVGDYAKTLREAGAQDVTVASHGFLWCLPAKSVAATK